MQGNLFPPSGKLVNYDLNKITERGPSVEEAGRERERGILAGSLPHGRVWQNYTTNHRMECT